MSIGLIGRKLGMSHIFDKTGSIVPVAVLETGPCYITAIKSMEKDGYSSVQLGYEEVAEKKLNKPRLNELKKKNLPLCRILKEFRVKGDGELKEFGVGQKLTVEIFKEGDYVDVTGKSIGKGFQGVMKRHKFHGGPATHGSMSHRAPGSIGGTDPARVFKGRRMSGHMGNRKVTVQNLQIVKIIPEENLVFLRGAVPGCAQNYLIIRKALKK
ncbi:MAG TPA: 50S ribosomal protein L3 [bacterium]|nr:50S ribosomal protein L3 [bacterium]